jgi:hypothetical protein
MVDRNILTNDSSGADSLKPSSGVVEPRKFPSGDQNVLGRTDNNFGYGAATTDGMPGERHRDDVRYPSGKGIPARDDTTTHFDKATAQGRSVGGKEALSNWMLQGVPSFQKPTAEPEGTSDRETGKAYDATISARDKAGASSSERLAKLRDAASGKGALDTSGDLEGIKLNPTKAVQRTAY